MMCGQRHEPLAPVGKEWVAADDEPPGSQLTEGRESRVNLAFGRGIQDGKLYPLRARRFPHVFSGARGIRIVRVHEQGDHADLGNQLGQQLEPLWAQLGCHRADACEVAARPGETGD